MENILHILQNARKLVPFRFDSSRIKFGGDTVAAKESYVKTHRWDHGWREEGALLLDADLNVVGDVIYINSSGVMGTPDVEVVEEHPEGEAIYLLSYDVKNDTEESEQAILYRLVL